MSSLPPSLLITVRHATSDKSLLASLDSTQSVLGTLMASMLPTLALELWLARGFMLRRVPG